MAASASRPHPATMTQLHLITRCPSLGVASVVVTGEVDMATEAQLRAALLGALTHHPVVLDLDLSACTFLDCSGVRVLVAVQSCAKATGCLVRARHAQPLVRMVLEMTGLLALLTAPADVDAVATTTETEPGISLSCPTASGESVY